MASRDVLVKVPRADAERLLGIPRRMEWQGETLKVTFAVLEAQSAPGGAN